MANPAFGAPSPAVSAPGYALYFDGDDFVDLGNNPLLSPWNTYTIEAWVRADGPPSAWSHVFTCYEHNRWGSYEFIFASYTLGLNPYYDHSRFVFNAMSPLRKATSDPFPSWALNGWFHLAAVCDWDTARLYINGQWSGQSPRRGPGGWGGANTLIGALRKFDAIDGTWKGWIDDVRFWDCPRTQEQIEESMYLAPTGHEPHLVGRWSFDDGEGQVASDSGPNGLHGILGSSTSPGPDDPQWVVSTAPFWGTECAVHSCPPGILCYDDGGASTFVSEDGPASFLVKFTVPSSVTGLRQVAMISWFPGNAAVGNPRAVVRGDLAGGLGTGNACVAQEITPVTPFAWNQVDLEGNSKKFVVGAGDVFYAGIHGTGVAIGADAAATLLFRAETVDVPRDTSGTQEPLPTPVVPYPDLGPDLQNPCWDKRNYLLGMLGTRSPAGNLSLVPLGDPDCGKEWCSTCIDPSIACTTDSSLYCYSVCTGLGYPYPCLYWCSRSFQVTGHDWLIRARLAGTLSPELVPGCYDRVFVTPTPTATPFDVTLAARIEPESPTTLDDLRCVTDVNDLSGMRQLFHSYRWFRDGVEVPSATESLLHHDLTVKDESFSCIAAVTDGTSAVYAQTAPVTVLNSTPTTPVVEILPPEPAPNEPMVVNIVVYSTDADGDQVDYRIDWYESEDGGEIWIERIELRNLAFISGIYLQEGDLWRVIVTPYEVTDGKPQAAAGLEGEPGWDQVYVGANFDPVVRVERPGPGDAVAFPAVVIVWSAEDADGDPVTVDIFFDTDGVKGGEILLEAGLPASGTGVWEPPGAMHPVTGLDLSGDGSIGAEDLFMLADLWMQEPEENRYRILARAYDSKRAMGDAFSDGWVVVPAELTGNDWSLLELCRQWRRTGG